MALKYSLGLSRYRLWLYLKKSAVVAYRLCIYSKGLLYCAYVINYSVIEAVELSNTN